MTIALILVGLVLLLFTGMPIFAGLSLFGGALLLGQGGLGSVTEVIFGELNRYLLVAIPLFSFMAHVMIRGKIVDDLYDTAYTLTRHLPGGLGIATIAACTIFAAISGSSVATALTIGAVAIPQMIRFGYAPRLAYGLVAAGGTLGILIPPSGPMVLYGVTTNTSIGGLFMAGVVPGLMMAAIFIVWVMLSTAFAHRHIAARAARRDGARRSARSAVRCGRSRCRCSCSAACTPACSPRPKPRPRARCWRCSSRGVVYRNLGLRGVWDSAVEASRTSAMLFMILAGAAVLGYVLTKMRIPQQIVSMVVGADIGVAGFLIAMMVLIFILGMFLESISIILITTPVILPAMQRAAHQPDLVRHPADHQPRARADHAAGGHEPVHHQGDHAGADARDHPRRAALRAADDRRDGAGDDLAADRALAAGHDDRAALTPARSAPRPAPMPRRAPRCAAPYATMRIGRMLHRT